MRERWRSYGGDLYAELARHDLAEAWRLHPSDRERITRALEVIDQTGISLKDWQTRGAAVAPLRGFAVHKLFKNAPRDTLYARANARFGQMLEQGALDEVRALPPLDPKAPMMKAIGVRELLAHLRGELTLDEARSKAQTATCNYIKRQLTWWRGQMQDWEEI